MSGLHTSIPAARRIEQHEHHGRHPGGGREAIDAWSITISTMTKPRIQSIAAIRVVGRPFAMAAPAAVTETVAIRLS